MAHEYVPGPALTARFAYHFAGLFFIAGGFLECVENKAGFWHVSKKEANQNCAVM